MELMPYLAGGAAVGLIASCWGKIKEVLWKICNLFVQQVEIPSEAAHNALVAYLIKTLSPFTSLRPHVRRLLRTSPRRPLWPRTLRDVRQPQHDAAGTACFRSSSPTLRRRRPSAAPTRTSSKRTRPRRSSRPSPSSAAPWTSRRSCARRATSSNQLSWSVASAEEKQKSRFVIHYFPKRSDNDEEHGYGRSGLAWYQQGQYRLLAHTAGPTGQGAAARRQRAGQPDLPEAGQGTDQGDRAVAKQPRLVPGQGHPLETRLAALRPARHRQDRPGPRLRRGPEHADLRLQSRRDEQPRADQGVERHAGQRAVHRADRGHRQRLPRPGERGSQERRHDVVAVRRARRRTTNRRSAAAR